MNLYTAESTRGAREGRAQTAQDMSITTVQPMDNKRVVAGEPGESTGQGHDEPPIANVLAPSTHTHTHTNREGEKHTETLSHTHT